MLRACYDLSRQIIHKALLQTLGLPNVHIEQADQIARALSWYEHGMDFADAMHIALAANANQFVTFDRRFAKSTTRRHLAVELL